MTRSKEDDDAVAIAHIMGASLQPLPGWSVVIDCGLRLVGKLSIDGMWLSPAYEMTHVMTMTPKGPMPVPTLAPPVGLLSLCAKMPITPTANVIPFSMLSLDERRAVEILWTRFEAEVTKAKAAASGLVLPPAGARLK